jgi:hypothetical protein
MSNNTTTGPARPEDFNELDNWLEIMDKDPPLSLNEKRVMYERLLDIMADTLEHDGFEPEKTEYTPLNKTTLHREMRRIIDA